MSLAVIENGTYYHHEVIYGPRFRDRFDRAIYAPELREGDLDGFRAVMVADRVSPTILRQKRRLLLDYVRRGGTLIVLGENQAHTWAPGVEWTFRPTNFWWWLEKGADPGHRIANSDHEIFRYVSREAVVWHYHGLLHPPPGAIPLVTIAPEMGGGPDGTLLYDHPGIADGNGRLVVTTLDPFYHTGSHFMPAATRFLAGLLDWTDAAFRG
jgi:hypothetical protein